MRNLKVAEGSNPIRRFPVYTRSRRRLEPLGLITTAGTLRPIVPPSIALIIYGSVTGTSVGKLFAAALPTIVLMLVALVILTYVPVFSMRLPNTFF
ncbi:TRAP transporter large permease subunit [Stappia indica]|uniref:TRAP transporter large permease subunit n=1 Tax=Stappia indica TaxID=538381 RepID=UPI000BE253FA|nr:TRAP transporter large permease subunit [Stappia indica]